MYNTYGSNYSSYNSYDEATIAFTMIFVFVMFVVVALFSIIVDWKIFTKAGVPGWASLIPIYNVYKLFEIANGSGWTFLLLLIPIFGDFYLIYVLCYKLPKAYGYGIGFALGMFFFTPIFMLILAFGSCKYIGPQS